MCQVASVWAVFLDVRVVPAIRRARCVSLACTCGTTSVCLYALWARLAMAVHALPASPTARRAVTKIHARSAEVGSIC